MPDAFVSSVAWHYMVFALSGNGDFWRIWFGEDGQPLMQKLLGNETEYSEAFDMLRQKMLPPPHGGGIVVYENNPGLDSFLRLRYKRYEKYNFAEGDLIERVYDPTIPYVDPRRRA